MLMLILDQELNIGQFRPRSRRRRWCKSERQQELLVKLTAFTIEYFPTRTDTKFSKDLPMLQAASAYTHFRVCVMDSNVDFMEMVLKAEEFEYKSDPC